ncbi:MAG: DUF4349 domain-containing protein [Bacteroidota bacterium]
MQPKTSSEQSIETEITKQVIKTGGIDFESKDIDEDLKSIREVLTKYQAYIENERQSKTSSRIECYITIRVPAETYDTLFESLSGLGARLDNRYSNVEDVTQRYYDLVTRIKNRKALEQRYLELLGKASKIEDLLEIEKKLNEVRTEIEGLQGQFNYLSKQVRLSTINLSFYEELPYVYGRSNRKGFGARIVRALDQGWQGFLSFFVGLITIWPFLLIAVGAAVLSRRFLKFKKKK